MRQLLQRWLAPWPSITITRIDIEVLKTPEVVGAVPPPLASAAVSANWVERPAILVGALSPLAPAQVVRAVVPPVLATALLLDATIPLPRLQTLSTEHFTAVFGILPPRNPVQPAATSALKVLRRQVAQLLRQTHDLTALSTLFCACLGFTPQAGVVAEGYFPPALEAQVLDAEWIAQHETLLVLGVRGQRPGVLTAVLRHLQHAHWRPVLVAFACPQRRQWTLGLVTSAGHSLGWRSVSSVGGHPPSVGRWLRLQVRPERRGKALLSAARRLFRWHAHSRAEPSFDPDLCAGQQLFGQALLPPATVSQLLQTLAQYTPAQRISKPGAEFVVLRNQLIVNHLRFCRFIIRRYGLWRQCRSLTMNDLLHAGVLGLCRALELYDPNYGNKFLTYASHWVRQFMQRALQMENQVIRIPVHQFNRRGVVPESLRHLFCTQYLSQLDSLHADPAWEPAARPGRSRLLDDELRTQIGQVLASLDARTQEILRWRFGLDGHAAHTLDACAQRLGITRERVRQLESKALTKLRADHRASLLSFYWET